MSLSSQSLGYGTDKANLQHPRKPKKPKYKHKKLQNKTKQNQINPGLVASYNNRPGNGFWSILTKTTAQFYIL